MKHFISLVLILFLTSMQFPKAVVAQRNRPKQKNQKNQKNSQTGNGNLVIDSTLEFAKDFIQSLEPFDLGKISPCENCAISGVHTVYRSGDVTCILEDDIKHVNMNIGVRRVNATCKKCATLLVIGDAHALVTNLKIAADFQLNMNDETQNQVKNSRVVDKGQFRFSFKGNNAISRLLSRTVTSLGNMLGSVVQAQIGRMLPKALNDNKDKLSLLFGGC